MYKYRHCHFAPQNHESTTVMLDIQSPKREKTNKPQQASERKQTLRVTDNGWYVFAVALSLNRRQINTRKVFDNFERAIYEHHSTLWRSIVAVDQSLYDSTKSKLRRLAHRNKRAMVDLPPSCLPTSSLALSLSCFHLAKATFPSPAAWWVLQSSTQETSLTVFPIAIFIGQRGCQIWR